MMVPQMAGRYDDQQQTGTLRRQLLLHQREFVDAGTAAAVFLGQIDAQESEFARLVPQFGERLTLARLGQHVVDVVEALTQFGNGCPQFLLLFGFDETHHASSSVAAFFHTCEYRSDLDLLADGDRKFYQDTGSRAQ